MDRTVETVAENLFKVYFKKALRLSDGKARLAFAAELFLGKPYVWEALGEGRQGKYSQAPLIRDDAFDCVTYMNTILSLLFANNMTRFKQNMRAIRYKQGIVDYTQRTDWFTDLEWLPKAQALGWLRDVTSDFVDAASQPLVQIAETIIDKPSWYKARCSEDLQLLDPCSTRKKKGRLARLQAEGAAFVPRVSTLPYIPLADCMSAHFYAQMPAVSMVVIVRPNWPIRHQLGNRPHGYGTNLNVSHLGIAIKNTFYHASRERQQVVAVDLEDYQRECAAIESVKGIHVEEILFPGCRGRAAARRGG